MSPLYFLGPVNNQTKSEPPKYEQEIVCSTCRGLNQSGYIITLIAWRSSCWLFHVEASSLLLRIETEGYSVLLTPRWWDVIILHSSRNLQRTIIWHFCCCFTQSCYTIPQFYRYNKGGLRMYWFDNILRWSVIVHVDCHCTIISVVLCRLCR